MSGRIVNVRVEDELYAALRAQANQQGANMSELVRALLRAGAGVCDLRESGYREGKLLGYSEARAKLDAAYSNAAPSADAADKKR